MKFTLLSVPISQITGNNLARSKRSPEHQARLNESAKLYNILQPILIQKKGDAYRLIAGFGRLEAATAAGFETIPAQVYEGELPALDLLILACQENNVRESMSFMDQVDALESITKGKKLTDTAAGELIGLKQSVTSKILSAKTRLAEDVLLALSSNGYGYSFAYPLSKASHDEQREIIARMIPEKWSRARLEQELKPEGKRTVRVDGEVTLSISFPKTATYEAIKEALTEFLKTIKTREQQGLPISILPQVMR